MSETPVDTTNEAGLIPPGHLHARIPPRLFWPIVIAGLAITASVTIIAGKMYSGSWYNPIVSVFPLTIRLIEARGNTALMVEEVGASDRVLVQRYGMASWLLPSADDTTASSPALSPDGDLVAYRSDKPTGTIVVVSLTSDERAITEESDIAAQATQQKLQGVTHRCPWTPIAWSPESTRLTFFVCSNNNAESYVAVGEATSPKLQLNILPDTLHANNDSRSVQWLSNDTILVLNASTPAAQATTYQVP